MFELDTISMIFTNVKKCSPLHAVSPCELGKEEKSWNPYVPTPQYCLHWNCFIFKKVLDVMIFSRFLELLPPPPSSSSSPSSPSSPSSLSSSSHLPEKYGGIIWKLFSTPQPLLWLPMVAPLSKTCRAICDWKD